MTTGFMNLNGALVDLYDLYETLTFGPPITTGFISKVYNQDLGSIFLLGSNLQAYGLDSIQGGNCGYKLSNGTDIGTLFCARGFLIEDTFVGVINGNFTASTSGLTLSYSSTQTRSENCITTTSGTTTAFAWISNAQNIGGQFLFIPTSNSSYTTITIPNSLTKFICFQSYGNANHPFFISQNIFFSIGDYTLTFYAIGSNVASYNQSATLLSIEIGVRLISNPVAPTNTEWTAYSIDFTVSPNDYSSSPVPFIFRYSSSVTSFSTLCVTGFNIIKYPVLT